MALDLQWILYDEAKSAQVLPFAVHRQLQIEYVYLKLIVTITTQDELSKAVVLLL